MADQQQEAVLSVLLNGEQAKKELSDLEKKAKELAHQIDEANKAGNQATAKQLQKDLDACNKSIRNVRRDTLGVTKVLNNLSTAKPKELNQTLSILTRRLNDVKRGSEAWNILQRDIQRVRQELKNISAESAVAGSGMNRLSNGFNKYFGMVTTFLAGITGLSFTFRKLSEQIAHLDDVYSDVMKTTGMTRDEVVELNEEFKKMDTRTSREQLNLLARDAGKLGITSKKDILDFVEAGNQINVALGEDLGADAIKNIGKMVNVFSETSKELQGKDLKGQMLAVGSAVNALGQASTASEPYLVQFAGRLGGIAKQANISMSAILGFGSSLDQDMQQVEMSASALQKFIVTLSKDSDKIAKAVGIPAKELAKAVREDMNGALMMVFEQLNKKGGLVDLVPIFKDLGADGVRAGGVISSIAGSLQQVKDAQALSSQAMIEGISVTNEYNIKNNNLQAQLEKARKNFTEASLALGERLNPILLKSTNTMTYIIKILPSIIDWFEKYGKIIVNTTVAIGLYTLAVNASVIADKLKVFWTDKVVFSKKKLWVTMLNNPIGVVLAAATLLYTLYKSLNKELTLAEQKQRTLNDVNLKAKRDIAEQTAELERLLKIAKNEILSKEQRLASIKKINEISPEHLGNLTLEELSTNKAKIAIDKYKDSLMQAALAKAAFDKIVELQQQKLDLQNKSGEEIYKENTNILQKMGAGISSVFGGDYGDDLFTQALTKNNEKIVNLDAQIEKLQKLSEKNYASTIVSEESENKNNGGGGGNGSGGDDKASIQRKRINDAMEKLETSHWGAMSEIKKKYLTGDIQTEYEYNQALLDQQDKYDSDRKDKLNELLKSISDPSLRIDIAKQIADIEQKHVERLIQQANKIKKILLDADPLEAEKQAYENRLRELGLFNIKEEKMTDEQQGALKLLKQQYQENLQKIDAKGVREKLKELDAGQAEEEAKLAEKHRTELWSEGKYQEELLKLRQQYLNKKLAILGLSVEQTENLNKSVSQNQADTSDFKTKERQSAEDKYNLVNITESKQRELAIIADFETRGVITHEEAIKAKNLIDQEYLEALTGKVKDVSDKIQSVTSNLTGAISGFQEAESMSVSRKYDQQINAAGKNAKKVAKLEEQKEKELNKIKAKYADKQFVVTVAQVVASTAVSAMEAYKAMAGIPYVGPALGAIAAAAAVAYGASQIAVAKEQRDAAKAGYDTGGFTPLGPSNKPQGVVHSEEFVGNRYAVRNPAVRKVFNIVDEAQKNNTVSALTEKDFSRALDYREAENRYVVTGISNALTAVGAPGDNQAAVMEALVAYLGRNAEVTDRLNDRLDEPFVGEVTVTGKKGIKENMDLYNQMIKNASRK
ncbi:phage tail tape measure protein [Bacteroidia bacterium]|nr:phage tail tape measure protein [Bacteroidia bacterium]